MLVSQFDTESVMGNYESSACSFIHDQRNTHPEDEEQSSEKWRRRPNHYQTNGHGYD